MPRAHSGALSTVPQGNQGNYNDPLYQMQRRMNQDFDRVLRDPFGAMTTLGSFDAMNANWPSVDVKDCGDSLCVQCELPGLRKEDVNIELRNDQLVISGERSNTWKSEGENWVSQERRFGSFSRSIPLPEGCKPEDVSAQFGDGVLDLKILKPEQHRKTTHRIQIA